MTDAAKPAAAAAPAAPAEAAAPKAWANPYARKASSVPAAATSEAAPQPAAVAPVVKVAAPAATPAKPVQAPQAKAPATATKPAAKPTAPTPQVHPEIAALKAQVAEAHKVLKGHADSQLGALPESARETIKSLSGGDPAKVLSTIEALRAGGLLPGQGLPKGATTTPDAAPAAAKNDAPTGDAALFAQYQKLVQAGAPMLAADFRNKNAAAIARAMKSQQNN